MQHSCPECGTGIAASAIRPPRFVASCQGCGGIVRFSGSGADLAVNGYTAPAAPAKLNITVDTPPKREEGYRLSTETGGAFEASFRWFRTVTIFLTIFVIFWDGFLVAWYLATTAMDAPIIFKLFPLIHVAVGLGLTWHVLCGYFNRTFVSVKDQRLTVRHGPIPWPFSGGTEIGLQDIEMFETAKKVSRNNNSTSITWIINARLSDGRTQRLFKGLEKDLAEFLVWRLQQQLR